MVNCLFCKLAARNSKLFELDTRTVVAVASGVCSNISQLILGAANGIMGSVVRLSSVFW